MKLPLRIILPIVAALTVAGLVVLLVWWQLTEQAERLRKKLEENIFNGTGVETAIPEDDFADTGDTVLLHLRQGDIAALQGDWGVAQREYEASVEAGGGVAALRKLAQAQMQRRDMDGVRSTIERLEEEGAKDEDLLLLRVITFLRTGELVQAKSLLDAADDSPQKHYGLALLGIVQSDHAAAQLEIQNVLNGWDPTLRAYARILQTAYDEYAQFPKSRPIHLITLQARTLAQVQECELALPLLSQVLREQDDYRDAWIVQGYCELVTERFQESLVSFERAYSIDPEKPETQYFLGRTYLALKDHKNAITFLQYAIENGFQPQKEARRRLAQAALEAGNTSLALEQYQAVLAESDTDLATYEKLVTAAIALNKKEEAVTHAQAAVDRWPDDALAYELLGTAAVEAGKVDDARAAFTKALELDPELASAREGLEKL